MKTNNYDLKSLEEQVHHDFSIYIKLGDFSALKKTAPYFMREYLFHIYRDEDRSSDAYIRCYERIEHFVAKFRRINPDESQYLLPYLKRCAINQYLNVQKQEIKIERTIPTVPFDDEFTKYKNSASNQDSKFKEILIQCIHQEKPIFEIPFALKFDLPLSNKAQNLLTKILIQKSRGILEFWEEHCLRRMKWQSQREKHLERINQLNHKMFLEPNSPKIFKWKHYKKRRIRSLEYLMGIGLYNYEELGVLMDKSAETLCRCLRYRTDKWKNYWESSSNSNLLKKAV
jgi:hypothetical protein